MRIYPIAQFTGSKFLGFCEHVETLGTGPESFDVTVNGGWMLKPILIPLLMRDRLCIEPKKLVYQIGAILSKNNADDCRTVWDP
jgi:hypothetical protein